MPHLDEPTLLGLALNSISTRRRNLDQERSLRLARSALGSSDLTVAEKNWLQHWRALEHFSCRRERLPREHSTERAERQLARWLRRQSTEHDRLTAYQRGRLKRVKDFQWGFRAENWYLTAREVADWIDDHRRRPARRATDPVEARLGAWYDRQRLSLNRGQLAGDRLAAFEAIQARVTHLRDSE